MNAPAKIKFERDPYLTVVAMSREQAREFVGTLHVLRVEYIGQADPERYRFGARVYHVYTVGAR
jgi:hypothetical protein